MTTGSQSIDRAATILSLIVRADGPVSYTDLVDETALARSTVSRLLQALERNGLIDRNKDGQFTSGALFAHYAARFDTIERLNATAQPVLERVAEETNETVNLGVPRGNTVVQIAQIDSTYVLGATNWQDIEVPPHCSALGKVLYAYEAIALPRGRLEGRTPSSVPTGSALRRQLATVRRHGYAVAISEFEEGLDALAAPVRGSDGQVQAALGVSGPSFRLGEMHKQLGDLLMAESARLTRALKRPARN